MDQLIKYIDKLMLYFNVKDKVRIYKSVSYILIKSDYKESPFIQKITPNINSFIQNIKSWIISMKYLINVDTLNITYLGHQGIFINYKNITYLDKLPNEILNTVSGYLNFDEIAIVAQVVTRSFINYNEIIRIRFPDTYNSIDCPKDLTKARFNEIMNLSVKK